MQSTMKAARALLAFAAAAVLAVCVAAFAHGNALADPAAPSTADDKVVTITKKLVGPTSELPGSTDFTFVASKVSVNDLTEAADLAAMPAISDTKIAIGSDNGKYISKKTEGATTTLRNDAKIDFKTLTFPHAGVYVYKVKETGQADGVTMSQAEYTIRVYVKNTADGNVTVDQVTVDQDKNDKNGQGEGKVNPNPNPTDPTNPDTPDNPGTDVDGGSGFAFVNTMTTADDAKLVIKKVVTGEHGDKTKDFDFSLTITVPTTATLPASGKYEATIGAEKVEFVSGTPTSFKLHDGETLNFAQLPSGTEFTYTETGVNGYTASSSTTLGTAQAVTQDGTAGGDFSLTKASLAKGDNASTLTNAYKTVTPTGIVMSVFPFVLMVAVPVLAAAGYVAFKRRFAARA